MSILRFSKLIKVILAIALTLVVLTVAFYFWQRKEYFDLKENFPGNTYDVYVKKIEDEEDSSWEMIYDAQDSILIDVNLHSKFDYQLGKNIYPFIRIGINHFYFTKIQSDRFEARLYSPFNKNHTITFVKRKMFLNKRTITGKWISEFWQKNYEINFKPPPSPFPIDSLWPCIYEINSNEIKFNCLGTNTSELVYSSNNEFLKMKLYSMVPSIPHRSWKILELKDSIMRVKVNYKSEIESKYHTDTLVLKRFFE